MRTWINVILVFFITSCTINRINAADRSFVVDWDKDRFLKDGEPYQFVAGSFHYFRSLNETWAKKLRTMRAAGLTAVTTYVEWSLHNPKDDGIYNWEGMADLENFIRIAEQEDLLVILRPGPYICAERDMGGFPYWLLHKYPNIQLRTYDSDYLYEVQKWYDELMPRMSKLLYGNGGPIIMVQVENEYGSFGVNDQKYKEWLKDLTESYVGDKAVLFTNDGPSQTPRGFIKGVLATLDFGAGSPEAIDGFWDILRKYMPKGPLVNIEYYPGWLTHWQEDMARVATQPVVDSLKYMLKQNASVNFYMFYGGTNFGFTAGANDGGPGRYQADITSYDYDAPMDEAGDATPKYMAIREAISEFFTLPEIAVPNSSKKVKFGPVSMKPISVLTSNYARKRLNGGIITNRNPMSFEQLNQYSGLVLYETQLPSIKKDPVILHVEGLHDRAYVYVDRTFIGILSREMQVDSLAIPGGTGNKLQILVENQGRINFNIPNDFKGILGKAKYDGRVLNDWTMTQFPMENITDVQALINTYLSQPTLQSTTHGRSYVRTGPTIFYGSFDLKSNQVQDTYLNPIGWGKGLVFINGFNLGRYWPLVGPQVTVFVPKQILKKGQNDVIMIEYQRAAEASSITFDEVASLDG